MDNQLVKVFESYWSILKSFLIGKNVFHRYLKTKNILEISRKSRTVQLIFCKQVLLNYQPSTFTNIVLQEKWKAILR